MKTEKIKLGKPKKKRVVWGFNPSSKVVLDKKKKLRYDKKKWRGKWDENDCPC